MTKSKSVKSAHSVPKSSRPNPRARRGRVGSSFNAFLREMGDYEVVKSRAFDSIWDAIERADVAPRFKMRAQLMHALRRHIVENDLTPATAAKRMGVAKSRIAALSCGEINAFDIEALLGMSHAVGFKIEMQIS